MEQRKNAVLVTGTSGNLGLRLLPQLQRYNVIGVDLVPLRTSQDVRYAHVDLGAESACREIVELLRETNAFAVIHLAFMSEPFGPGICDSQRQWQINVAGTARVMEAITEVNRHGGAVTKFIFTSSAQVYGPDLESPGTEASPLNARTLTYAIHKRAADETVRYRASSLGSCRTFVLRSANYAGANVHSNLMSVLRGLPTSDSERAIRWREENKRVPFFIPFGERWPLNLWQFVHVEDLARLIAHILQSPSSEEKVTILNVSGRDGSTTLDRCMHLAGTRAVRLPGYAACRAGLGLLSKLGLSSIPTEALPYLLGSYPVDTARLRKFLGNECREIIHHTVESALAESLTERPGEEALSAKAAI